MLNETIRNLRKAKGMSQEELAVKLNVVRQTISKWEKGLSVPDSSMLISLAEELDTSVNVLLGETIRKDYGGEVNLGDIAEKLEDINYKFAKGQARKNRIIRYTLMFICGITAVIFVVLLYMNSEYLTWDYKNPELAVAGTLFHGFEFIFVRLVPFIIIGSAIGIIFTYKRK